jgi:thiamine pyrophosphate-dependent acetolactate synthase large subunit-like protein
MKAYDLFVRQLEEEEIENIFCLPGEARAQNDISRGTIQ